MSAQFVLLSGCSGGGKSTLLAELARRGFGTVEEPGRRVIKAEFASGGQALPWVDLAAFARRAIEISLNDRSAAAAALPVTAQPGWVFFDRGLVDAAAALAHATGEPALERLGREHRYNETVFLTPPWPEIFAADAERRLDLEDATAEYERLQRAYRALGYRLVILPKTSVESRADLVLAELGR